MCFQQGAQADINILMGAAFTFIKEGSRHISAGAEDGTLRGNEWQSNAACSGICKLSCSLHVNQGRPDVSLSSRDTSDLKLWFASCPFRFNLHNKHCLLCLVETLVSLLSLYLQFLTSPSLYRFSFVSCSLPTGFYIIHEFHIVLWLMQDTCFAPVPPPTSLAKPHLTGLNFRITVGYCIYYSCLLQFPLILEVEYNQFNMEAVGNEAGNKPELSQLTMTASIFKFWCIFHMHYSPTDPDWLRFYSRLKPKWWLGNLSNGLVGPAGWFAATTLDLSMIPTLLVAPRG